MATATEFDIEKATPKQVAEKLTGVEAELKGLLGKGDDATPDELDRCETLVDLCNTLKAKSNDFAARFKKFDATAADLADHLHKPANRGGMVHATAEAKGAVNDKGVAVGDRIEGVQAKSQPWAIFGDRGGFYAAVKGVYAASPDAGAMEKVAAWDQMQRKTTPAGMYEGSDPDGGVLVPAEIARDIYTRALELENLWARVDNLPVKGNSMTFPKINDKDRRDGFRDGGVLGYWEGEGAAYTATKPTYGVDSLRLKKLSVLVYATDELLADSPYAVDRFLTERAAAEIAFKLNDAVINGNGTGMPLGLLASGCLIAVAKDQGQAAATLSTKNIDNMYMRLWAPYRKGAVWLTNQDCESALQSMQLPIGVAGVPTYLPPGGVAATPYATLKGLPVLIVEQCATLGSVGDIILANLGQYRAISKGGIDTAMSMHVRFLTSEQTFRFLFRADGQPKWGEALTPYKGSTTYSPFVALAARN